MALTVGARLGSYEIAALIGKGGMGEVYRALDATLGRQVAIKVLPDTFAQDRERLGRFEREAKALAALNHPHIAQIFFVDLQRRMTAVAVSYPGGGIEVGQPAPLFRTRIGGVSFQREYLSAPDGQRFLLDTPVGDAAPSLSVILNWNPES